MHTISLKLSSFLIACGFGILVSFLIGGSTNGLSQLFAPDAVAEARSCQVKLVGRDGQTVWMSCLQWEKHRQFELDHSR